MKTPYDLLAGLLPKPSAEDIAAAQRLGVTVEEYRAIKLDVLAEQARAAQPGQPADTAAEEAVANRLRREPGLIKPRNTAPNLLVQAARAPGEVAQLLLTVMCYVAGLAALIILGGDRVQKMPGIFQCVLLALLVIPAMWASSRIWEAIGEGARDLVRALVRFWPVTLVLGLFVLAGLKLLFRSLVP